MKMKRLQVLVNAALMAAIVCVATLLIQIPIPATGGYVNLGDGFVILCGVLLGPVYGGLAAGIGALLTDLITGYAVYIPATLIIKGAMAVAAWFLTRRIGRHLPGFLAAGAAGGLIMTGGYFIYESLLLGFGKAAIASLLPNLAQSAAGLLISTALLTAINRSERLKQFFYFGKEV